MDVNVLASKLSCISDHVYVFFCTGCHVKVHKDHFDKSEEFISYCKGEWYQVAFQKPVLLS